MEAIPAPFVVYPNPVAAGRPVTIHMESNDPTDSRWISFEVFSLAGRLIYSEKQQGQEDFLWYGRDLNGRLVSSGIYFIAVKDGKHKGRHRRKILVL